MEHSVLGNLVKIQKGKKNLVTDLPDENSNRIIQIEDLRNDNSKQYTNDNDGIEVNEDDLLIAWDGANAGLVGFGKKGYLGSTLAVLRKKENIFHTHYVGMFLRTKFDYFQNTSTGATIPHISRLALEELEIPLPAYADQIRIAHLLEKIENLIVERKKSIELLEELVRAAFYQLFGDAVRNEKGWEKKELINIVAKDCVLSYGIVQPGEDFSNGIPVVRPIDLKDSFVGKNGLKLIDPQISKKFKRTILKGGEILFCVRGTTGIVSIAKDDLKGANVTRGITPIFFDEEVNTIYIFHLLRTAQIQKIISDNTYGSALKQINLSELRALNLVIPPLDLQNQFAGIAQKIEAIKAEQEAQVQVMEELYSALTQKAFAGSLDLSLIPVDEALLPAATPLTRPADEQEQDDDDGEEEGGDDEPNDIIEKVPDPRKDKTAETGTVKETAPPIVTKEPKPASSLTWDTVSFKEVATYISQHFGAHYFNTEMLLRYLEEDLGIQVHYFTSAEQKKNPQYEQADDFLSFVAGALTGQNTFLGLEQVFYNAETENIPAISFTPNDLETLAGKTQKERSGIYFRIKDETTPG